MKNFFIITVVYFVMFSILLYSQEVCETIPIQGEIINTTSDNGIYLSSKGNLKVLVVFVSFKDDSSYHSNWPVGQPPNDYSTFIDPDSQTNSTIYNNLNKLF